MMNSFNVIDCVEEKYKPENHREFYLMFILYFIIKESKYTS